MVRSSAVVMALVCESSGIKCRSNGISVNQVGSSAVVMALV